ncbi:MAG: extracellular solute-binding protein [Deltaproteobacteria bacterium]|nr:extracellular solute-binding protein [Deltaproteobacteria bacterium]
MKALHLTVAILFLTVSAAWGQSDTIKKLANYTGSDYHKMLEEGAKKEGKVVWYTSLSGKSYKTIQAEFAKKYPDVKIEVYRAGSKDIAAKILAEHKAGKYLVDAIESTPGILQLLRERNIIMPYSSPEHKRWPAEHQTKAKSGGAWWVTDRESFIGLGYNTDKMPKEKAPKSFDDLLDPSLKGKIVMSVQSTGDRMLSSMINVKGEEYVDKLKKQQIKLVKISGTATRDLVISGEFVVSPSIFRNHALVKIAEGAPIGWNALDEVPTNAGGSAIFANSPHPHAALLLTNFVLIEGQQILQKFHYGMAWLDYPFKRVYPERGMTSKAYNKISKKLNKQLRSIGRR